MGGAKKIVYTPKVDKFMVLQLKGFYNLIIKDINVEVDRNQICSLAQEYKDEQFKSLITPENICSYESACVSWLCGKFKLCVPINIYWLGIDAKLLAFPKF